MKLKSFNDIIGRKKQFFLMSFLILLLVISSGAFLVLLRRSHRAPKIYQITGLGNIAKLYLTPADSNVEVNDSVTVSLYLDTNETVVDGVDVIINFNPDLLRLKSIVPNDGCDVGSSDLTCFKTFTPIINDQGGFDEQRVKDCANTGSYNGRSCTRGQIKFGAVTFDFDTRNVTNGVKGNNLKIVDLVFMAVSEGTVDLSFDFPSVNETTDTNVVAHDENNVADILAEVAGAKVVISEGTPSPSPAEETTLDLKIKFMGVPANDNNMNLPQENRGKETRITIAKESDEKLFYSEFVSFEYNETDKIWGKSLSFTNTQLPSGKYIFKIKGPAHRQILFCRNNQAPPSLEEEATLCKRGDAVSITVGQSYNLDFSAYPLEFGDVDWDGSVGVQDYSFVKACKEANSKLGEESYTNGCQYADGNLDGVCDITDIDLLYRTLSIKPDDE